MPRNFQTVSEGVFSEVQRYKMPSLAYGPGALGPAQCPFLAPVQGEIVAGVAKIRYKWLRLATL